MHIEVVMGVVVDSIILRGVYKFFPCGFFHLHTWEGQNIRNTSQYNALHTNSNTHYHLNNKQKEELIILSDSFNKICKVFSFVKVEFMVELLYWFALIHSRSEVTAAYIYKW